MIRFSAQVALLCALLSVYAPAQNAPSLLITAPASGLVVQPGQTVTVDVSGTNPPINGSEGLVVSNPILAPAVQTSTTANEFILLIPSNIEPGSYGIAAIESTPSGPIISSSIVLTVQPTYSFDALAADVSTILFTQPTETCPLVVQGSKSGLSQFVSNQFLTFTSANPSVAVVDANGIVSPVSAGTTQISMSYGSVTGTVTVTVGTAIVSQGQTAAPSFSPAASVFTSPQTITLSDSSATAAIYYTTDGSTPSIASALYTGPFIVSNTATVSAIAIASGYSQSSVVSATYTINIQPTAATPTFSPSPGTYSAIQSVTIADATSGATIYYTADGTTPTAGSTLYTGPISIGSNETLEAIAISSGYTNSQVATATYTINIPVAATPTFGPAGGVYTSAQTVTLSDSTTGATIYYTTNGTTPTVGSTLYKGPISVSSTETIQAIAVANGYTNSQVASAAYTINIPVAATPTLSPVGGVYTSPQTVTVSDSTAAAALHYTTNGTTPTASSTLYTGPISVSSSETVQAIVIANGYMNSQVASAAYTINIPVASTPSFSPSAGVYTSPQTVTLSDSTSGATIYYTTNGSMPTIGSTLYTGPVLVSSTETIEAIAIASGYTNSPVSSATFTINIPVAAVPTLSPSGGVYAAPQTVTIADTTPGASLFYTTNGTPPSTSSTRYTSPILVGSTETIQAIAIVNGYTNSPIASTTYTINIPVAGAPVFSIAGVFTAPQIVTITDATAGASIYYTVNGTLPTVGSILYTGPITVSTTETVQAIGVASGYTNSAVSSAAYTINLPQSFTLGLSASSLTITAGQTGSLTVAVAPQNGFNQTTTFACSGLPSASTCGFSPASLTPNGAASASTTLTITTSASVGAISRTAPFEVAGMLAGVSLLLSRRRLRRRLSVSLLMTFGCIGMIAGCAGHGNFYSPTTSTVSVTATAGSLSQSSTFVLTVK